MDLLGWTAQRREVINEEVSRQLYGELTAYTLSLHDADFINSLLIRIPRNMQEQSSNQLP